MENAVTIFNFNYLLRSDRHYLLCFEWRGILDPGDRRFRNKMAYQLFPFSIKGFHVTVLAARFLVSKVFSDEVSPVI